MRIRVEIDAKPSLKKEKLIRLPSKDALTCDFQYEKLPNFCFIYGRLGYIDRYCEILFQVHQSAKST